MYIQWILILSFIITIVIGPMPAQADVFLPAPGQMLALSPAFSPVVLKGIKLDPNNPLRFHFYVDQGDSVSLQAAQATKQSFKDESSKLIKYFLASLTIPEQDLWVNLSPYEKDRIIPKEFGQTEMGRDLLAQDYMLKQITASLIYPESQLGKEFWQKIYTQAQAKYGTKNIPVNTFNKVWIVPEKAVVYENAGTAFVLENHLKVMLEEDYLAQSKNNVGRPGDMFQSEQQNVSPCRLPSERPLNMKTSQGNPVSQTTDLANQIVRELVIPALTKEVNEGKNFAQLRQVFYSLILATWYKKKIKDGILNKVYSNQKKLTNLSSQKSSVWDPQYIYQQYLKAFKKGVYSYIKEEPGAITGQTISRKYFSGGVIGSPKISYEGANNISRTQVAGLDNAQLTDVLADLGFDQAMNSVLQSTADFLALFPGKRIVYELGKVKIEYSINDTQNTSLIEAITHDESETNPKKEEFIIKGEAVEGENLIELIKNSKEKEIHILSQMPSLQVLRKIVEQLPFEVMFIELNNGQVICFKGQESTSGLHTLEKLLCGLGLVKGRIHSHPLAVVNQMSRSEHIIGIPDIPIPAVFSILPSRLDLNSVWPGGYSAIIGPAGVSVYQIHPDMPNHIKRMLAGDSPKDIMAFMEDTTMYYQGISFKYTLDLLLRSRTHALSFEQVETSLNGFGVYLGLKSWDDTTSQTTGKIITDLQARVDGEIQWSDSELVELRLSHPTIEMPTHDNMESSARLVRKLKQIQEPVDPDKIDLDKQIRESADALKGVYEPDPMLLMFFPTMVSQWMRKGRQVRKLLQDGRSTSLRITVLDQAMSSDNAKTVPTAHVLNDQEILVQYLKEKNQQKFWILLDKLKQQGDERLDNLFIKLLIKAPYKTAFLIGLMLINLDSAVRNRIADSLLIEIADAKQVYKSLLRMHNEIYKNEPGGKVMLEIAAIEGLMQVFHTIALFHQEEASMRVRFHEEIANQEPLTPSIIRDLLSLDPQEQAEGLRKAKLLEKIPDSIWQLIATRAYFDEKAQTRDLAKKFLDDAIKQGRHRSKETAMVLKTEQVNLQTVWDQSIRNYLLPILKDFDEFTGSVPDDLLVVLLDHVILAQNMEILDHFYQAKHAIPPGMKDKVEHIPSDNLLAQQVAHDFSYNHDINLRFARVLSYLKVSPEAQIMNLGSGTNPVKLSQWPQVLNVDNTDFVAAAQHHAKSIDAQFALQPGENPYDVVLMHHWGMFGPPRTPKENISFWQKTWKYVKPGGWLVLMIDPNYAVPWEMEKFLGQIQLANMPDLPARVMMVLNDNQSTVRINPYMVIAIQRSSDAAMTGEISRGTFSVESRVSKGKTFITHLPVDKAMKVDIRKINEGVRKINAFLLDLGDEEKRNSYLRLMALYVDAPDGTKSWNELNFRDADLVREFVEIFYDDPSAFSDFQDIAWFYLSLHSKVAVDQMIDEINGILVSDFDWEGAVSHIEPGAPRDRLYDYLESLRNLFGKGQIPNNPYEKTFRLLLVLVNGEIDLVTERSYLDVDLHQVMGTNNFLEGRQLSYFFYIPIADNLEFFNARLKKFENDTKWKDAIKALRKVLMVPDQAMSALQLTTEDVQAYKKLSKDRSRDYVQEIPKEVLAKKERKDQESALDSAMKGGIDFNPTQMNMQVKGKEDGFKFNFNGIEIDAAQVTGASFTIRQMTPVTDLPAVLGLHAMNLV